MISSTHNPKIQWIRTLQSKAHARRQERLFVIEGVRLVEEALAAGWEARWVIYTDDLNLRGRVVVESFANQGTPVEQVTPHVLEAVSETQSPQGILAVIPLRDLPLPERPNFIFVPDRVRDPGNLGTMLRTAATAGVQAVFLPPSTVDAFSPKVVRSAMGAHFRIPIQALSWEQIITRLSQAEVHIYLADAGGKVPYTQVDFRGPLVIVIGGEAEGVSPEAYRLPAVPIAIPMPGGGESLNAAVAAGVLLYEVVRQRNISTSADA